MTSVTRSSSMSDWSGPSPVTRWSCFTDVPPRRRSLGQPRLAGGAVGVRARVRDAGAGRAAAALEQHTLADQRADDGGPAVRGPLAARLAGACRARPEDRAVQPRLLGGSLR